MTDQGTTFEIDIPVKGKSAVDEAASAVDRLENSLDKTTKVLERIGQSADKERDKLRLATELGDQKGAEKAAAGLRLLIDRQTEWAGKVNAQKTSLDEAAAKFDVLKKKEDDAKKSTASFAEGLSALGGPAGKAGESATGLGERLGKLQKALANASPATIATAASFGLVAAVLAVGVVVVAVGAKVASMIGELGRFGLALAETRTQSVALAAGWLRTDAGAAQLNDKINELTTRLPLARDEIAATAQGLASMGFRGQKLNDALQIMTIRAARLKFGPDFERQMLSSEQQSKVLQQNLQGVFGGLNTDTLLRGVQKLVSLFDETTESGHAIKVVFESIFQPLFESLGQASTKVERFFLQLEVLSLRALIALKPHATLIGSIGKAFAVAGTVLVSGGLIAGVISLTAVMLPFAAAAIAATLPVLAVMAAVAALVAVGYELYKLFQDLKGFDLGSALVASGEALVHGLVRGITNVGGKVWDALKGTVAGAVTGVKDFLGIHSPSKVFEDIGFRTGEGMSIGVESASGGVRTALESMTTPPTSTPAASSVSGSSGANFAGAVFNFYGVEGAEDAESRFRELYTRAIEGDAVQLGANLATAA